MIAGIEACVNANSKSNEEIVGSEKRQEGSCRKGTSEVYVKTNACSKVLQDAMKSRKCRKDCEEIRSCRNTEGVREE